MPIQKYGLNVLGQVRIDTVLFKRPRQKKGRGRPRKYGKKYTKTEIKRLLLFTENLTLYGREQKVNYRTAIAKARFLNGQLVRFIWCEFEDDKGKKRPRLLLSTNTDLTGLEVIKAYEKRWYIEPMFNQLKNVWGMKQAWQRNKPTTVGRIRLGLIKYFSHVRVRDWWNVKSQKFQPPDTDILRQFEVLL